MNSTKTSSLSFYNEQGILILTAKQFDTGRMFVFHIMDNDVPFDLSGCTAYLRIAKADGTQFQGHECCTVEGSQIIISTSAGNGSQILAAAGTNVCELHLKDANDIGLTTWTFHIVVEPRVHDGSHMSSIDSYDVLDNMINMEKERIANEEQRKENEKQRKENEANRNTVFEEKIEETNAVITDCHLVIDAANQKISSFDAEINEIVDGITDEAQSYADNAKASETNAANAAYSAADSAATASQKAGDAAASAVLSQSYAVGGTQSRAGEDVDNAKYYSEKSQETLQKLQETTVTSIKGNAESAYRTGDVNITPDNIGLGNVNNTSDENKPVSNAQRTAIDAKVSKSGDTMNGNLEMTNHSINNVLSVNGTVGENDFWRIAGGDTGSNAGYLEIATADDGTEPIYVRQYNNGAFGSISRQLTLLDEWGNTLIPGTLIPNNANSGAIGEQHRQFSRAYIDGIGGTMAENDYWGISGKNSGIDCGYLDIATGDNGNEPIYVTQYSDGNFTHVLDSSSIAHRATLLDENGNTSFPGQVTAPVFRGQATAIRDSGDGRTLTFNYSADGLDDPEWLAAWNGNELRGVAASKYKGGGNGGIYAKTSSHGLTTEMHGHFSYDCIQFDNGFMIYRCSVACGQSKSVSITFPVAFVGIGDTTLIVSPFSPNADPWITCDQHSHDNMVTSTNVTGYDLRTRGVANGSFICNWTAGLVTGINVKNINWGTYCELESHISFIIMGNWRE